MGGACGRLASWWGKGPPRRRSVAGLRGRPATLGLRTAQTPTGGSSEEFSAMGATLTEQRRVRDEGFRVVNCFSGGRERTVPEEEAPANYVPAAAVIRRGRALSGVTGRKARAGGRAQLASESLRLNRGEVVEDGSDLRARRGTWNSGWSGEMRRDPEEHRWRRQPPGRAPDAEARKRGERTGLDTPVVHAVNDVH